MANGGGGSSRAHKNQMRSVQVDSESTADSIRNRSRNIDAEVDSQVSGTPRTKRADGPKVTDTSPSFFGSPMDEVRKFFGVKKDAE